MSGTARNPFSSGWVQAAADDSLRLPGALSYVRGSGAEPLRSVTLAQLLDEAAASHGSHDAAIFAGTAESLSWYDLQRRSNEVAAGLLALGIRHGNRVGVCAPSRVEWLLAQFGAARIGAVVVAIDPAADAAELEHALAHLRCRVLICDRFSDIGRVLDRRRLPNLGDVIVLDEPGRPRPPPADAVSFAAFVRAAGPAQYQRLAGIGAAVDPDDAASVQFTRGKGDGGRSGAVLSHFAIVNNARFAAQAMQLGSGDRLCIPVALHRGFGLTLGVLACVASGATMVFPGAAFDAEATLDAAERHRCTALHGSPSMFAAVLASESIAGRDLSLLRTGIVAGAPCPAETLRGIVERLGMKDITVGYGMAETSPLAFQTGLGDTTERRIASIGRVHPQLEAKLVDASGRRVAIGRTGELCLRGYSLMRGYWEEPEATRRTIDEAGWLHSGDLAKFDAEGYCRIVGRLPDRNAGAAP